MTLRKQLNELGWDHHRSARGTRREYVLMWEGRNVDEEREEMGRLVNMSDLSARECEVLGILLHRVARGRPTGGDVEEAVNIVLAKFPDAFNVHYGLVEYSPGDYRLRIEFYTRPEDWE